MNNTNDKSLESWIWDAACSIRGAQEAPKFKDFILPLIFTKRLCDVFDDELNRIALEVGSRAKAFKLVEKDRKLVRFYLPLKPQDPQGDAEDGFPVPLIAKLVRRGGFARHAEHRVGVGDFRVVEFTADAALEAEVVGADEEGVDAAAADGTDEAAQSYLTSIKPLVTV